MNSGRSCHSLSSHSSLIHCDHMWSVREKSEMFLILRKWSTMTANNCISQDVWLCLYCTLIVCRFSALKDVVYVTLSPSSPPLFIIVLFAAETFLSMDTSSGNPTLDGRLMSTLNCGNFSSSTGYFHPILWHRSDMFLKSLTKKTVYTHNRWWPSQSRLPDVLSQRGWFTMLSAQYCISCIYWQAGSGQSVWLEEMADWGSCIKNWTALLPLLVSQTMSQCI